MKMTSGRCGPAALPTDAIMVRPAETSIFPAVCTGLTSVCFLVHVELRTGESE
jgi:hypothetical protein